MDDRHVTLPSRPLNVSGYCLPPTKNLNDDNKHETHFSHFLPLSHFLRWICTSGRHFESLPSIPPSYQTPTANLVASQGRRFISFLAQSSQPDRSHRNVAVTFASSFNSDSLSAVPHQQGIVTKLPSFAGRDDLHSTLVPPPFYLLLCAQHTPTEETQPPDFLRKKQPNTLGHLKTKHTNEVQVEPAIRCRRRRLSSTPIVTDAVKFTQLNGLSTYAP